MSEMKKMNGKRGFSMKNNAFCKVLNYFIPLVTPFIGFVILERMWRTNYMNEFLDGEGMSIKIILLNLVVYYAIWGILTFLIGRSRISSIIFIVLCCITGLANYFVIEFRRSPININDFRSIGTAMNVAGSYEYKLVSKIVLCLFGAVIMIALNLFFHFKLYNTKKIGLQIALHIVPAIICVCAIWGVSALITRDNISKIWPDFSTTLFTPKAMADKDGYLLSSIYMAKFSRVEKPDGYSDEKARSLLAKYANSGVWDNDTISKIGNSKTIIKSPTEQANILVIMNECFSDLRILGRMHTNKDYMPFTHKLLSGTVKNTISGYFYSSVLGGNTANTEYEFLTGDTMAFYPAGSVPYQQFVQQKTDTMASILSAQGARSTAAHPYVSYGWDRNKVYPLFGFDEKKFAVDMGELTRVRIYNDDVSFYNYLFNNILNRVDKKYFSFNVTMQNHGGYSGVPDPANFKAEITYKDFANQNTSNYLSLIKISDDEFKKVIDKVKKDPRPTIVVMFGDHQPNDITVHDIYSYNGKDIDKLNNAERFNRYKVPVVMWANYDIPEDNHLITSANFLGGMVQRLAGYQTSSYQNFIESFRQYVPAISAQGFLDKDGSYHEISELDKYTSMANDYRTLQYYHIFK